MWIHWALHDRMHLCSCVRPNEACFTTLLRGRRYSDIREKSICCSEITAEGWGVRLKTPNISQIHACQLIKKGGYQPLLLYRCICCREIREGLRHAVHHLPWWTDRDFSQREDEKRFIWIWRHLIRQHWEWEWQRFFFFSALTMVRAVYNNSWYSVDWCRVEGDLWLTYCLEILWDLDEFGSLLYRMLMRPGTASRIRDIWGLIFKCGESFWGQRCLVKRCSDFVLLLSVQTSACSPNSFHALNHNNWIALWRNYQHRVGNKS